MTLKSKLDITPCELLHEIYRPAATFLQLMVWVYLMRAMTDDKDNIAPLWSSRQIFVHSTFRFF